MCVSVLSKLKVYRFVLKICCGCFGPVGGTDDYCGHDCTAKNGGTVKKHTYTWFWVRTSLPKRVWNRCMEYKVKSEDGNMVSYRLMDGNTTPEKVTVMRNPKRCLF